MIALSMHVLGDNGFGWRIPSVIFGSIAILAFYLLMKQMSRILTEELAPNSSESPFKTIPIVAAFLFSFDNLAFVQSRIATLDIFTVALMIVGFYWYFSGHTYLSATAMALSSLCKITGLAGPLVIIVVHLARTVKIKRDRKSWNSFLSWFEKYLATFVVAFLAILAVLDRVYVGYSTPFQHLQFILNYSSALVSSCPNGIISCPWQWLINQVQIPYLIVSVKVTSGGLTKQFDSVTFWGAMNPSVLYLTIPAMAYCAYSYVKKRDTFTIFLLSWFVITYLPYYPAAILGHRVTYLFYFLPTLPAVCAAIAYMIADQNPPKLVVIFYLAVVLVSFYLMFPFKTIP
jgi:predicted membrane-bound dolichyl-phosphate-mannose-protein mannosyltransferase